MTWNVAVLAVMALVVGLVFLWVAHPSPRDLRDLVVLAGVVGVGFFAFRGAWSKWQAQPPAMWSSALLGCFGVAAGGWVAVGVMAATVHAVGNSFAMVIVAPLMIVFGTLAGLVGVGAAVVSFAVIFSALTRPTQNPALLAVGGAASIALNIGFIVAMVRAVFH